MACESGGRGWDVGAINDVSKNGVGLFQLIPSKKSRMACLVLDYCFISESSSDNTKEKAR
jgi:hypothetical protein